MNKHFLFAPLLGAALVVGAESRAEACGGCFIAPSETATVVTDHRMIFSISKDQSTLYDQIRYSGNPASFAWVLPFAGDIEVGVSSDELFTVLDQQTQTVIQAPFAGCPGPPSCGFSASGASSSSSGAVFNDAGVTVLHNEVVGPYETVQLKATDPQSLQTWLSDHGYAIPETVKPVIAAYQSQSFNFLALKLVPGQGVQSMRPVRVTTKGSNVALPLRMVAAGTGATVGITLWVVAEGRYEPSNFPSFVVRADDITWDYSSQSSDYTQIRAERTAAGKGKIWEIESSTPGLQSSVSSAVGFAYQAYDDEKNDAGAVIKTAREAFKEDMQVLFAGIPDGADRITRIRADLAHDALVEDLTLKAAATQDTLPRIRNVTHTVHAPVCPSYTPCPNSSDASGNDGGAGNGASPSSGDDAGCQTSPNSSDLPWLGASIAAGLLVLARKRRRGRR